MSLAEQFFQDGKVADCPVYDMHGHMGPFAGLHMGSCDTDSMVRLMDRAGVKLLAFCHHAALMSGDIGNGPAIEAVREYPDRLRAYCGINPRFPARAEQDLASYDDHRDTYIGLKFLPDYHKVALTDDLYAPAWQFADARGLIVLTHTWGNSPFDGSAQVRNVAERYPNVKLLMGHSCHGEWDAAIRLANDCQKVYLELCAVTDERGVLERLVAECGSKKIVFGTDCPWFNHHYYIGSVLGSGISDDDCHNIFHRNAERLVTVRGRKSDEAW